MLDASLEKLSLKEDYAFHPEKRAQIVQTLNKGTQEYYMYHLQWQSQQLQQKQAAGQALTAKEADDAFNLLREASQYVYDQSILTRFRSQLAVLAYDAKPEILLKELAIDDNLLKEAEAGTAQPQESPSSQPQELGILKDLPTALCQEEVQTSAIFKQILDHLQAKTYDWEFPMLTEEAWAQVLSHPDIESILVDHLAIESLESLFFSYINLIQSPNSLEIVDLADASQVDVLVVKLILRLYKAGKCTFAHRISSFTHLTNAQLKLMRELEPALLDDEGYIAMLERRILPLLDGESLTPPGSSRMQQQAAIHQEWLSRMCNFVMPLSPKFNYYKFATYLLDLQNDLEHGQMSKEKFIRFVNVPQRLPNANWNFLKFVKNEEIVNLYSNSSPLSSRVPRPSQQDLNLLIEEYLDHLLLVDRSTKDYEAYFDKSYLDQRLGRTILLSGDKDTDKWSRFLSPFTTLDQLAAETFIKFASDNPTRFLPSDPVSFKLRAKNAGRILVRVFEIKTFEYLQHFEGVVGKALDLDGLSPNWEITLTSDRPPIEQFEVTVDLPQLTNKRGAFVMDVISNGANSCVFFTKGCLDYTERHSPAGHILTILDENNQAIRENCSVWLNGHTYKPNEDGDILIPYGKTNSGGYSSTIKLIHDGFTFEKSFKHYTESYELRLACHLDRESLVAGHAAKVLLKPTLLLSGVDVPCPINLLEQVVLNIESTDMDGISSTTTVTDFKVHDVNWASYTLQVPENLANVLFTLSGRIKLISTGEYKELVESYDLDVVNPEADMKIDITHKGRSQRVQVQGEIFTVLRKSASGYHIVVLGKNGEKRSDVPLQLDFFHSLWSKTITQCLRSNEHGLVDLGPLEDIKTVICRSTGGFWCLGDMHHDCYTYPSKIHAVAGETIHVPCLREDVPFIRQVNLFSYTGHQGDVPSSDYCALDDYTRNVKKHGDFLVISGLDAGYYTLRMGEDRSIDIVMAKSKTNLSIQGTANQEGQQRQHTLLEIGSYKVEPSVVNTLSSDAPIPQLFFMSKPVANDAKQAVEVQLHQWSPDTRVCVVANKFAPSDLCYKDLARNIPGTPSMSLKSQLISTVVRSGRILSEEYQYILNRKTQMSYWVGNLLTKPSTLLTPWSVADSKMETEELREADISRLRTEGGTRFVNESGRLFSGGATRHRKVLAADDYDRTWPQLSFLAQPSVVLLNLLPDAATGVVSIPFSALKDGQFIQVFATDGLQTVQRTLELASSSTATTAALEPLDFKTRDLRFKSILDYQKHYIVERSGTNLIPPPISAAQEATTASLTLASTGSSSAVRVIQSVRQIYDLMLTLVTTKKHRQTLRLFGFVVDWTHMSNTAKNEKFSKFCSHELNLFLYEKDRPYYDAVVAPFLRNKLVKSFMDEYLLELPLDHYCAMNEFHKLTALEKALLARRVPAMRPVVSRWLQDRVSRRSTSNNIKLFQTIMKSGSLDETSTMGPVSPAYSPTSLQEIECVNETIEEVVEREVIEESDDDMGFGLFDDGPSSSKMYMTSAARKMKLNSDEAPGSAVQMAAFSAVPAFGGAPPPLPRPVAAAAPVAYGQFQNIGEARGRAEEMVQEQFKQVDLTKVQAETYYYNRQDHENINSEANAFWVDYVEWEGDYRVFLSQNFVVNTGSFTDVMATLALMGVTFKAADASVTRSAETRQLIVTSKNPTIVFHASTKEVDSSETLGGGMILLTQKYYAQDDKYVYDERLLCNVRRYLSLNGDLHPLKSYGAHVILMNATSNPIDVFLDLQLPQGAMPIYDTLKAGHDVHLEAHDSFQYEYGFYFPEQGVFPHYPAHVSNYERIVAYADPALLHVRHPEPNQAANEEDKTSWQYLLHWGTKDELLRKLETSSLKGVPMDNLIRFLVKDAVFYKRFVNVLRSRREYHDRVWSLSVVHRDRETLQEYLARQSIAQVVGYWFDSQLLSVHPAAKARGANRALSFEVLEFFPLINARAHKTKRDASILNDKFREQYDKYMEYLSQKPALDCEDLLLLVVYLLAQERTAEAKEKFAHLVTLQKQQQQTDAWFKLQFDYLWIYLQLCVETPANTSVNNQQTAVASVDIKEIQKVLDLYRDYPVKRWNTMFGDMQKYVDEIVASDADQLPPPTIAEGETVFVSAPTSADEQTSQDLVDDTIEMVSRPASSEPMDIDREETRVSTISQGKPQDKVIPMADFKIGTDNVLTVRHRGVTEITVEYYAIDAEAMFSASPLTFVEQGSGSNKEDDPSFSTDTTKDSDRRPGVDATALNSYRYVKPNMVDSHAVQRAVSIDGILTVPVLPQYVNTNCMISITTSPPSATKHWRAYYSQTIAVDVNEKLGLFRVISKKDNRPIRGGYVKVYAHFKDGSGGKKTVFWKDGYTDLVGRFNYAQVSSRATNEGQGSGSGGFSDIRRFVVYVNGGSDGCVVKSVPVPPV